MKGSTHSASSSSSHLLILCSLPGANELLMAAEPLINPPSPSLHSSPLCCPPVLRPPPSLLAELHPHWLLLLTVCQHISGDLVRIYFFCSPTTLLPHHPSLFLIIFLSPISSFGSLTLSPSSFPPTAPLFYFLLSHSCSHDAAAAGAVAASINIVLMLWWLEAARC